MRSFEKQLLFLAGKITLGEPVTHTKQQTGIMLAAFIRMYRLEG